MKCYYSTEHAVNILVHVMFAVIEHIELPIQLHFELVFKFSTKTAYLMCFSFRFICHIAELI